MEWTKCELHRKVGDKLQNVSEEFKQAIKEPAREFECKIEFPDLMITDENIKDVNISSNLLFGDDFEIGTAPMDTAKVELVVDEGEWGRNLLRNSQKNILLQSQNGSEVIYIDGESPYYKAQAPVVWKDLSGNGNDGVLKNFDFTENSGWVDGGLKFDGVDDYIQLPELNLDLNNFTYQLDDKIISFRGDSQAIVKGGEIEYSGRNLFLNSRDIRAYVRYGTIEVQKVDDMGFDNVLKVINTATEPTWGFITAIYKDLTRQPEFGEQATLSLFVRGIPYEGETANLQVYYNAGTSNQNFYDVGKEYKWLSVTFDVKSDSSRFHIYPTNFKELYIAYAKLEIGNNPTSWTPAPEDITETNIINHTAPFVENNKITLLRLYNRVLTDEEIMQNYQGNYVKDESLVLDLNSKETGGVQLNSNFTADRFTEKLNGEYTVSLDVMTNTDDIVTLDGNKFNTKANEWTRIYVTKNFITGTQPIEKLKANGNILYYRNIKLEKGSTATPWTPAPEDILDYNYEDKECDIKLGIKLPDETTELLSMGKYTVEKAIVKNNIITLDCVDRMYKAEKDFEVNLMFPTTISDILQSACEQSDIPLKTVTFPNSEHIVEHEPVFEGYTCRDVIAQVAEIAGGYAKINRHGELEILNLTDTIVDELDGENHFEYKRDEVASGRVDKVIVQTGDEVAEKGSGDVSYMVADNMFIQNPETVVDEIYNTLNIINYDNGFMKWVGNFALDVGDKITIDGYPFYIFNRNLKYTGGIVEEYVAPANKSTDKSNKGKDNTLIAINNIKTQIKVLEGEITQSIEKIENLIIDAANRLYQSQTNIPFDFNNGEGTVQLFRDSYHPYYKVVSNQNIDLSASFPDSQFAEPLGELGEVTVSMDVLVDVDRTVTLDGKTFELKANRWTRIHVTKEFTENTTKHIRARNPYSRKVTRDKIVGTKLINSLTTNINTIYYRNLQVQRGTVATQWTLTPEELEDNVNRLYSEIRQLEDSISLLVRRNDNTGRFEVNADGIIAEINKTDGVGRLKTVNVTIDDNGLTVDGGAVIIRDEQNTAIITPQGLKIMFHYQSSGELNGWQKVGQWSYAGHYENEQASISFQIPEKMNVIQVMLVVKSMPVYLTGFPYIPDGTYHPRNLRIYEAANPDIGIINYPANSTPTVQFYSGNAIDITDEIWGDTWTPTGTNIQRKIADITNIVTPGRPQTFLVKSIDSVYEEDYRYIGGMQFELTVDGYLRG